MLALAPRFVQFSAPAVLSRMLRCLRDADSRFERRQRTTTGEQEGLVQPRTNTRTDAWPTPHPAVNTLLHMLRDEEALILGPELVGMYLSGSLTLGNFTAGSDVDVVVATEGELSDKMFAALATMHDRLSTSGMRWADQLEMVYIPIAALRRHDPARAKHPYLGRGPGEHLRVITLHTDWVVQRAVLRDRGIILAGPPPTLLIEPISLDELHLAQIELMRFWWAPMAGEGAAADFLRPRGHQSLAVLTMCRMLYTLRTGEITSKSAAACWGQANLDPGWFGLIARADAWRTNHAPDDSVLAPEDEIRATQELIRQVAAEFEAWARSR
jgi:hypothetical protein